MHRRTCIAILLLAALSLGCNLIPGTNKVGVPTEVAYLPPVETPTVVPVQTATQPSPSATPEPEPSIAPPSVAPPSVAPVPHEPASAGVLWRAGGEGVFSTLGGLDTDGTHVFVAAAYQGILVFDLKGDALGEISPGEIGYVVDVKVGPQGTLYMADSAFHQVTMFSRDGDLLGAFGGIGSGEGEFGSDSPRALAVSAEGEVFVLDPNQDAQGTPVIRVQVFSAEGEFLRAFALDPEIDAWAMDVGPDETLLVLSRAGYVAELTPDSGRLIQRLGLESLNGVLPQAISTDQDGTMYVTAQIPAAVAVLDRHGQLIAWVGEETVRTAEGWPEGEFLFPFGVAVTPDGRYIVAGDTYESFAYVTAFQRW
jgi:DNA-binding beta-propeller fold protein YncE